MLGKLLNGTLVSNQNKQQIKEEVLFNRGRGYQIPALAVIQVGKDPASSIYVRNKRKACDEVGISSLGYELPENTTEKELLDLIRELNHKQNIHGILVQLPLPSHMNTETVVNTIDPKKDVDGFHPYNFGILAQGFPVMRPCTPYGIINLLTFYQIDIHSKHVVIVGSSNIVGKPMAVECLSAGATVTICHRATIGLNKHVEMADIIIVATGVRDVIKSYWLNPKQIIIDVGIHRMVDGSICGDVDFNLVKDKVSWITPVPGGVGPMTISALLQNTLTAFKLQNNIPLNE
ncbi:MAG: bifunctional methylenetetrahydrofolate dehydrogenase/methenyltetrahydrofolate cyclohydrolase FolD [Gammaproteobacteria bacterium]|nr:bifunctional methylenetetrahydrofolate dehydrogenase/methenyltetrahydrofolate cyclohydrolase FolD [Gammaproteobacteria bacterium]